MKAGLGWRSLTTFGAATMDHFKDRFGTHLIRTRVRSEPAIFLSPSVARRL